MLEPAAPPPLSNSVVNLNILALFRTLSWTRIVALHLFVSPIHESCLGAP